MRIDIQTPRRPDPELQPYLARDAMRGLNSLLGQMGPHEVIECDTIVAITTLIEQAMVKPK